MTATQIDIAVVGIVVRHWGVKAMRARSIPCSAVMFVTSASAPSVKNRLSPATGSAAPL